MVDVREVIAEAIPCNIVYGRPQAADGIISALHTAGFRILGPDEVDPVTLAHAARIVREAVAEGHEPFRLSVNAAFREINREGQVASVSRIASALDAALRALDTQGADDAER